MIRLSLSLLHHVLFLGAQSNRFKGVSKHLTNVKNYTRVFVPMTTTTMVVSIA